MFTEEIQSLLKSPETIVQSPETIVQERLSFSQGQVDFLKNLKLSVGIHVGGLNVSAQQLLDLSSGQIFEFEMNQYTKLSLFIDGERMATAKFTTVGDKLGIKIVEVKNSL